MADDDDVIPTTEYLRKHPEVVARLERETELLQRIALLAAMRADTPPGEA